MDKRMDFKEKFKEWTNVVDKSLENYINELSCKEDCYEKNIYDSMKYSLMAGGKRLRPVLALAVCDMFEGKTDEVLPFACAIEMIHTYSLIHDDLPAMDNDDYRRGRLTSHKVYGEAMAILTGDALLNMAFEIMTSFTLKSEENLFAKVKAINIVSKASGASGMIGGQVVDMESEGKKIDLKNLEYMHKCKTGALIKAPVLATAALCCASEKETQLLSTYAERIGLAFQIKDDILDVEGDFTTLGKKTGSDAVNEKSTFVTIYGLDESKKILRTVTDEAVQSLEPFGERGAFLKQLADYLVNRNN
jgi:geranylgeranyl diphosphate synthase, type II